MRNIIANQVPVPEINDIFITHLHVDHYADLPYLWAFAPFNGRSKPLRVIGPSGRTPALGTKAMCEHLKKMGAWHEQAFSGCPRYKTATRLKSPSSTSRRTAASATTRTT